ncbi:MAG: malto-oligosyltrehalose synthase [Micromonosporaceae bacterium]
MAGLLDDDGPPAGRLRPRGAPASTYRLQLRPGFGFADAAEIAGYLAALGVTHVYLSPILQAAPGSTHGYDVVDHSRISAGLGGPDGFRAMAARFREHGLGLVVDIVPNHMAIPVPESLNRPLWSALRDGKNSPFAHWFDVDWAAEGDRLLLPILAGPLEDCVADLIIGQTTDGPVLRYFDHVLPLREGTADLPLGDLLGAQRYRLADWRAAATELNYRRFFDITSLIAVRVEHPDVFAATHGLVLSLVAEGIVDGLRVDHPDGLADPRGYLRRLAGATGGAWVAAEKILTPDEELPADWPCAGTTGYDTLGPVGGIFVDPGGREPLTEVHRKFTQIQNGSRVARQSWTAERSGGFRALPPTAARVVAPGLHGVPPGQHSHDGFADVAHAAKHDTVRHGLAAEVARLARLLGGLGDPVLSEFSFRDLRSVLEELFAAFPVYRAYVVPGEVPAQTSFDVLGRAAEVAESRVPERLHPALGIICGLLLGLRGSEPRHEELVVRFQQTCGAVMAKGVEDTAFYRWSRLASLNEVGGDPDRFGVSPREFHDIAARLAHDWPGTLTTLSTHDTKRQEDVRARLAVLAEMPLAWAREVGRWHDLAARLAPPPEPDIEYLMWQTLVGAWPIDRDRLGAYLQKAAREAKTATSWTDPDAGYEESLHAFALAALADAELTGRIARFAAHIGPDARVNSLGAKLVQLTMPGVPDVYQGCELTGLSLVDPDNRRPVDFERRRRMLAALDSGASGPSSPASTLSAASGHTSLDHEKLLVTSRALRLRREHPDWFGGGYEPVAAAGPAAGHAVAFLRGGRALTVATRLPAGLGSKGGWADTALPLPGGRGRDILTGATFSGPNVLLGALTSQLPVALLVCERSGS